MINNIIIIIAFTHTLMCLEFSVNFILSMNLLNKKLALQNSVFTTKKATSKVFGAINTVSKIHLFPLA